MDATAPRSLRIAIYAGSFDPVTLGHIDIAKRAAADCDRLVVSVGRNTAKKPLFSVPERMAMLRQALAPTRSIAVESFEGRVADYARRRGAQTLVRGVRDWRDRINETLIMVVNFCLGRGLRTRLYQAAPAFSAISSSATRRRMQLGLDLAGWVPPSTAARLIQLTHNPPADTGAAHTPWRDTRQVA